MIDPRSCALCTRPLSDVEHLVQGESGAVCSSCIAEAAAVLDSDGRYRALRGALGRLLGNLDERAPFARSGPLLDAALALAQDDAGALREVGAAAVRLSQYDRGVEAWARIDREAVTTDDRLQRILALHRAHRYEEGLGLLAELGRAQLSGRHRALFLLYRVGFQLADDRAVERASAANSTSDVDEAEAIYRTAGSEAPVEIRAAVAMTRALIALRTGEPGRAVSLLAAAEVVHGGAPSSGYLRLLGDARSAALDGDGARAAWAAALQAAHPESAEARAAAARLEGGYPSNRSSL